MATNSKGYRLKLSQTEAATDRDGHKPKRPQTEMFTNWNGRQNLEWPHHITPLHSVRYIDDFCATEYAFLKQSVTCKSFGNTLSMRTCHYKYIKTKHKLWSYSWGKFDMPHAVFPAELSSITVKIKILLGCLSWKCGQNFKQPKIHNGVWWPFWKLGFQQFGKECWVIYDLYGILGGKIHFWCLFNDFT